jgi:hypothetical protein
MANPACPDHGKIKNCCSIKDVLGNPGQSLGAGAIPFLVGDKFTNEWRQGDLNQYVIQQLPDYKSIAFLTPVAPTGNTSIATFSGLPPSTRFRIRGRILLTSSDATTNTVFLLPTTGDTTPNILFGQSGTLTPVFIDYVLSPSTLNATLTGGQTVSFAFDLVYTNGTPVQAWSMSLSSTGGGFGSAVITAQGFIDLIIPD